ncbi:NrdH-redoxin [Bacillus thuringiensis]|uniref:NrdH-redoxin n=1 Tax=Bacillus thuringiensis TaxID=1428 RepID=A0AB36TUH5_BACTU|nr:glutaredoxin family protein [Bacillus thuringiensis]PEE66079.1 NrdH-redoxin [Bacillus thuringiensis]PEE89613.1 NrdH-redoxin [Bacillus thuringiensis]PEV90646.1 NrdH-redoxin [Bacillus thuringiensis]PFK86590.1 NrdH-redoxin [Bacillus thuringiensis]PFM91524.1 NrdH-redoxin [Bacillus thuringiensis]
METIIVYTKNACPNCEQVKWTLNTVNVLYETRNIDEDPAHAAWMADKGYMSTPVTIFPSGKELVGFDMGEFAAELGL